MESKINYTVVGLFVIVLGIATVVAGFWMTAGRRGDKFNIYMVYMNEAVSGLSEQAPVKFNGVQVGFVQSIRLNYDNPQQVILLLSIKQNTPITTSTVATLMAQGVTGITYVGLKAKAAFSPPLYAKPGQKYPVIPAEPSLLVQLDTAIRDITGNIKSISQSFRQVFNKQNTEAFTESLANVKKVTDVIAKNANNIDDSLKAAKVILVNTEKASKEFPQTMTELRSSLKTIKQAASNLGQASQQVSLTMKSGRATVQSITDQALPSTVSLIDKLNRIALNLEFVSKQLRTNPSIIIRGQEPARPGPGE